MSGARFQRNIRLAFAPDTIWADAVKKLAPFARADRDRRIAAGQFAAQYDTLVGGRRDAAEETLRPGELIVYRARSIGLAVVRCIEELRRRMPVRTGRYQDSIFISIRGTGGWGGPIRAASFDPARVGADALDATVWAGQPYSRKLDVQLAGKRPIRVSVPAGFFGDAAAAVRRAFPLMDAQRLYTVPPGVPWTARAKTGAGRRIEYPAVVIESRVRR